MNSSKSEDPTCIGLCLVMCTTNSLHSARSISNRLISDKLSACVTIVHGVTSSYLWNGEMIQTPEVQMIIKSRLNLFSKVCEHIKELHPYEIPEIIAIRIIDGERRYISWLDGYMLDGDTRP